MGFSVPPEVQAHFENILRATHKTRSEFFREILDFYFTKSHGAASESDVARALKTYWDLRSGSSVKVVVIGLAIISDGKKVLIGARKEKDEWVEHLSWVFPGGRLKTLGFDTEIKELVRKETDLDVEVKTLIAARVHPDSGFKDVQVVALYFHCVPKEKGKGVPGSGLAKLKWVAPSFVFKFFTTSVTDEVTRFLLMIEKGG